MDRAVHFMELPGEIPNRQVILFMLTLFIYLFIFHLFVFYIFEELGDINHDALNI